MKFSIITASYLGEYRTAAKNRDNKILRAVNSVLSQTFQDFEMIIIADGCQKTVEIMKQVTDPRISTYLIDKSREWSGEPRNKGLDEAKGDYIVYLDIDDIYGDNHLQDIANGLAGYDWVWFDDIRYVPKTGEWYENPCDINVISRHGTSNICHKRSMQVRWTHVGYAHDYYFILQLKNNRNFTKIAGGEYYVCHIPNAGGYDL
jgi:glycosyltransferase involved in cell wall biosynthesis